MLMSAKVISNIKFSLTGTLDDPQLTELGRDSKEISFPARTRLENGNETETPNQSINLQFDVPVNIQRLPEAPISG
jgi:hypothetical protein